jgi:hypothetical protein
VQERTITSGSDKVVAYCSVLKHPKGFDGVRWVRDMPFGRKRSRDVNFKSVQVYSLVLDSLTFCHCHSLVEENLPRKTGERGRSGTANAVLIEK